MMVQKDGQVTNPIIVVKMPSKLLYIRIFNKKLLRIFTARLFLFRISPLFVNILVTRVFKKIEFKKGSRDRHKGNK